MVSTISLLRSEFDHCFVCFWQCGARIRELRWLECHHIERKSHAKAASRDRRGNLMMACNVCHSGPLANMPHAEQLAYRHFSDPFAYDTLAELVTDWLPIRAGRSGPERVTPAEVQHFLTIILDDPGRVIGPEQYRLTRRRFQIWLNSQPSNEFPLPPTIDVNDAGKGREQTG